MEVLHRILTWDLALQCNLKQVYKWPENTNFVAKWELL
jgi:hypothetical protein